MIKRIELKNFMSHRHTVLELGAGLTVLVGPNNVGKSAVIAALQTLCRNDRSTHVMRHGAKECSVTVETLEGDIITWRRRRSVSYEINGTRYDRVGQAVPEQLHEILRLPLVDGTQDDRGEVDIHFGTQKQPIFLLDQSGRSAARFFASSSDASQLVEMQRRHNKNVTDTKREESHYVKEMGTLSEILTILQPVEQLAGRLAEQEQVGTRLDRDVAQAKAAAQLATELGELQQAAIRQMAGQEVLSRLSSPPLQQDSESLEMLLGRLRVTRNTEVQLARLSESLQPLVPPPVLPSVDRLDAILADMRRLEAEQDRINKSQAQLASLPSHVSLEDEHQLATLVDQLRALHHRSQSQQAKFEKVSSLQAAPLLDEEGSLQGLLERLNQSKVTLERLKQSEQQIEAELGLVHQALSDLAAEEDCPLCGSPLDAERLLRNQGTRAKEEAMRADQGHVSGARPHADASSHERRGDGGGRR